MLIKNFQELSTLPPQTYFLHDNSQVSTLMNMYNKNFLFSMVEKHITLHFSNLDPICNFILQSHRFLSLSSFFSHRAGLRGPLPTCFPSYTLLHSYCFHETNFELDQLPDLAQQLKQAVRCGDNRVYKNIILHGHQR